MQSRPGWRYVQTLIVLEKETWSKLFLDQATLKRNALIDHRQKFCLSIALKIQSYECVRTTKKKKRSCQIEKRSLSLFRKKRGVGKRREVLGNMSNAPRHLALCTRRELCPSTQPRRFSSSSLSLRLSLSRRSSPDWTGLYGSTAKEKKKRHKKLIKKLSDKLHKIMNNC